MAGQTRIDGNLIDTGTDPNDIVSVSVGDGRYPRLSQDNTLAGNLTVDGQVRSDNVTDSAGTGAPAFPNGMSATGAALTDPEITGGIYLGGTGSANYLDDYEEGSWIPTIEDYTYSTDYVLLSSYSGGDSNRLSYIKMGNVVYIAGSIVFKSTKTARITMSLPFAYSGSSYGLAGSAGWYNFNAPAGVGFLGTGGSSVDFFAMSESGDHSDITVGNSDEIYFNFHYFTT